MSRAICVLGMHRSGTSAATRCMSMLGAYLGEEEDLAGPASDNKFGFYERLDVIDFHNRLLAHLGTSWDTCFPLPEQWQKSQKVESFREELAELVNRVFVEPQHELWAWKDPRTCLLMPLWLDVLNEFSVDVSCLLIFRNPLEVAESLAKRNGFAEIESLGIWLNFNLHLLHYSQPLPRTLVRYEDLIENGVATLRGIAESLALEEPDDSLKFENDVAQFLRDDFRHARASMNEVYAKAPAPVQALTRALEQALNHAEDWEKHLDATVNNLLDSHNTMASLLAHDGLARSRGLINSELEKETLLAQALREVVAAAEARADLAERSIEDYREIVEEKDKTISAVDERAEDLKRSLDGRRKAEVEAVRLLERKETEERLAQNEIRLRRDYDRKMKTWIVEKSSLEKELESSYRRGDELKSIFEDRLSEIYAELKNLRGLPENFGGLRKVFAQLQEINERICQSSRLVEMQDEQADFQRRASMEYERFHRDQLEATMALEQKISDLLGRDNYQKALYEETERNIREELHATQLRAAEIRTLLDKVGQSEHRLRSQLAEIHGSRLWKIGDSYWSARRSILRLFGIGGVAEGQDLAVGDSGLTAGGDENSRMQDANLEMSGSLLPRQGYSRKKEPDTRNVEAAQDAVGRSDAISVAVNQHDLREVRFARPNSKYDVVLYPIIDWELRYQRPQQLMAQFADHGHRVFYLRIRFHENAGAHVLVEEIRDRVYGVQLPGPSGLDLYSHEMTRATRQTFLDALDRLRIHAAMTDVVSFVQFPFWRPLVVSARERWGWPAVYDCLDDYADFKEVDPWFINREEHAFLNECDLSLATARPLYAKTSSQSSPSVLVPNACEFEHFNHPATAPQGLEMRGSGPVIGYYGAIADWFDTDLIEKVATQRSDWNFVLVGCTDGADTSRLEKLRNVQFLGERPYADLPGYLSMFDVATIPFKIKPLTQATNPVKFFEYLSAGKPVVATPLPELEPHRALFYSANDADEFITGIEAALEEDDSDLVNRRIEFARDNTWEKRYAEISANIEGLFGKATIVVVSYQQPEYLKLCIESVLNKTAYPNFEVVVIDNASDKSVRKYLNKMAEIDPRIKLIMNKKNVGFPRANNIAIESSGDSEYVVFLNNDTVVTRGWLGKLVRHLRRPGVELVGPVTNWAGNEARISVGYKEIDEMDEWAETYTAERDGVYFDIRVLAMYCIAMRRTLLDKIGLLDERFGIGMFEDDDFSMRVRDAGGRVICAEDVFIHHWGRASFGELEQNAYNRVFEENRKRFEEKWGRKWIPHEYRRQFD